MFETATFLFVGEAGRGKSPLAKTLGMLFSLFHIEKLKINVKASYRCGNNLDFFRGEPGTLECSDIFDDGLLNKQKMDKVKAFQCNAEEDQMTYERWGGNKFPQNQGRLACNNPYDADAEKNVDSKARSVPHNIFWQLLRPTFDAEADEHDIIAVMKRASMLVFTALWIYIRPAGEKAVDVMRVPYQGGVTDLITAAGKAILGPRRKGNRAMPPSYDADMQWSLDFLKTCVAKVEAEDASRRMVERLDAEREARREMVELKKVKEEELEDFRNGHTGLARDTANDPLVCSDAETEVADPPNFEDTEVEGELFGDDVVADLFWDESQDEDPLGHGAAMDDESPTAAAPCKSSTAAASSSVEAQKVVIKQEPREDNAFVKRLKVGEKIVIDLD